MNMENQTYTMPGDIVDTAEFSRSGMTQSILRSNMSIRDYAELSSEMITDELTSIVNNADEDVNTITIEPGKNAVLKELMGQI